MVIASLAPMENVPDEKVTLFSVALLPMMVAAEEGRRPAGDNEIEPFVVPRVVSAVPFSWIVPTGRKPVDPDWRKTEGCSVMLPPAPAVPEARIFPTMTEPFVEVIETSPPLPVPDVLMELEKVAFPNIEAIKSPPVGPDKSITPATETVALSEDKIRE